MAELSRFLGILHKRFGNQLPHDILTNLPNGIIQRDALAKHTVQVALVSALGDTSNGTRRRLRVWRPTSSKMEICTTSLRCSMNLAKRASKHQEPLPL